MNLIPNVMQANIWPTHTWDIHAVTWTNGLVSWSQLTWASPHCTSTPFVGIGFIWLCGWLDAWWSVSDAREIFAVKTARSFIECVLNCSCLLLCRFCISMITLTGRPSLWKVDLLISSTFGMFFDQHFCGSQSSQKLLMPLHSFVSPGHRNNFRNIPFKRHPLLQGMLIPWKI